MRFTKASLVMIWLLVCVPALSNGQCIVEFDLDQQLGNGPDTAYATLGGEVAVDLWIWPDPTLNAFSIWVCNADSVLAYQDLANGNIRYSPFWTAHDNCGDVAGVRFDFGGTIIPTYVGQLIYEPAIDNTIGHLAVDLTQGGWSNSDFNTGLFDDFIGASISIGGEPTSTEQEAWGNIKTLFR